jgi:steroid 5-alpha reductase family enzyme
MARRMMLRVRWISALVFWILWLLSIFLQPRYPWIDAIWQVLFLLIAIATTVYFVADTILHRGELRSVRGYPRWFMRFAMDENEKPGENGKSGAASNLHSPAGRVDP